MIFGGSRGSAGRRRRGAGVGRRDNDLCSVCAGPRDIKYRRVSIPSDATNPQEPRGGHPRAPRAPGGGPKSVGARNNGSAGYIPLKKRRAYMMTRPAPR